MDDNFNKFISDSVYYTQIQYYDLIYKTKILFFESLKNKKSSSYFQKEAEKIWGNVDHAYMEQRIKELEEMISAVNMQGRKILNPEAEFQEIFKLEPESKFINIEKKYEEVINKYYKQKLKTLNNGFVDEETYFKKLVEDFDSVQSIIPYYNKDGSVRSYHNIASYNSMLYNTNLTKAGWNRTIYDSKLLENDLVYLPAHPGACPLCMPYQGRVYSISGKSKKYPPKEIAIEGGVGHPNCKHEWVLYWDSSQIQTNKFNSTNWEEYYKTQQKIQSLELERKKLKVNKSIYEDLKEFGEVDNINAKIKSINAKIKELK